VTRQQIADQDGSALIMAVFVTALLSTMGIALLHLSELNLKMNRAALNTKKAFYLAEAGVETGRRVLFDSNGGSDIFDAMLEAAAGNNDTIDFDPYALQLQYDQDGKVIGITGIADDVPLLAATVLGQGLYASFLTNDPIDGRTNLTDTNSRVLITGIGAGPNRSFKIVEAIIEPHVVLPRMPPAAITLIGSDPIFYGGASHAEQYSGEDCHFLGGGVPGLHVPIVGTTSSAAEIAAEAGMDGPPSKYTSGAYSGDDTGVDLLDPSDPLISGGLGTMDPIWTDCAFLQDLMENLYKHATIYCAPAVSCSVPEYTTLDDIVFVDGDFQLGPGHVGSGVVVVTGELTLLGTTTWTGIVLAIGEGSVKRQGGGNGVISGTTLVANISGPNGVYGDADDCQGDGASDPDLFGSASYTVIGGGNADIDYCSRFANPGPASYRVVDFRQL